MGFFCKLLGEWCVRTRLTEATVRTRGGNCDEDGENSFWCDGWDVRCPGGLGAGAWQRHVFDVGRAGGGGFLESADCRSYVRAGLQGRGDELQSSSLGGSERGVRKGQDGHYCGVTALLGF